MGTFTYPWPQELIVGTAPDKMKQFSRVEVRALLEAFEKLTGTNPLTTSAKLDNILRMHLTPVAARRAARSDLDETTT